MKYVVFQNRVGEETMVLFSDSPNHCDISQAMERCYIHPLVPISAGFAEIDDEGKGHCSGESITLNLKSRPEVDTRLLRLTMMKL